MAISDWVGLLPLGLILAWMAKRVDDATADRWHDTHELLKAIARRLDALEQIQRSVGDIEDRQRRAAGEESREERSNRLMREYEDRQRELDG